QCPAPLSSKDMARRPRRRPLSVASPRSSLRARRLVSRSDAPHPSPSLQRCLPSRPASPSPLSRSSLRPPSLSSLLSEIPPTSPLSR
ncbi:hypothetical protein PMAYCL1PPCAC_04194, partial [Pristionchus mayeri]